MAAVDDVMEAVTSTLDGVGDVDGRFGHSISEADDALDKAMVVGDQSTIDGFTAVKDDLEKLREQLEAIRTGVDGVLGRLEAIKSAT